MIVKPIKFKKIVYRNNLGVLLTGETPFARFTIDYFKDALTKNFKVSIKNISFEDFPRDFGHITISEEAVNRIQSSWNDILLKVIDNEYNLKWNNDFASTTFCDFVIMDDHVQIINPYLMSEGKDKLYFENDDSEEETNNDLLKESVEDWWKDTLLSLVTSS